MGWLSLALIIGEVFRVQVGIDLLWILSGLLGYLQAQITEVNRQTLGGIIATGQHHAVHQLLHRNHVVSQ